MSCIRIACALLWLTAAASAEPSAEKKGLRADEGCLSPPKAASEKLTTCPIASDRVRIWCPNGRVFDRDGDRVGVAVMRSVCEMNQVRD